MDKIELSARQMKAISCILVSSSIEEGLKNAEVAKSTYYEWLKEPNFSKMLYASKIRIFEDNLFEIKMLVKTAVETCKGLLTSDNESIRLRTAELVLNQGIRLYVEEKF